MTDGQQMIRSGHISRKVRRRRTVFTQTHLDLLLKTFEMDPYPGISVREKLSQLTGVHESRIQVWFQNRRARKSKTFPQGAKNLPQENKWLLLPPTSHKVNQSALSEGELYRRGPQHENIYRFPVAPVHPLNHLDMNGWAGAQHFTCSFPYQTTNTISSGQLRPIDSIAQQYPSYVQAVSGSPLSQGCISMERYNAEYASCVVKTLEPVPQEYSLWDILAEFQPCWTEVANNTNENTDCCVCSDIALICSCR